MTIVNIEKNIPLNAYSCASPIRLPVIQALAKGCKANHVFSESHPKYIPGDSIVWGLIRGAKDIMHLTRNSGYRFFHVDNAYFGRNLYYRVTLNDLQICNIPFKIIDNRYNDIFDRLNISILPWRKIRNGPIVICPSSNFLHTYYGSTLDHWINQTIADIRKYTDRPIKIRYKEIFPKGDIDRDIHDAWCVVTHVSAAALDALRIGVPIVTTGKCAASQLGTPLHKINEPLFPDCRNELFSCLAWGQFDIEEMKRFNIPLIISEFTEKLNYCSNPSIVF